MSLCSKINELKLNRECGSCELNVIQECNPDVLFWGNKCDTNLDEIFGMESWE